MLLYNKVFDPYHTFLRMLSILFYIKKSTISYEKLRLYDFLLAHPSHILNVSLPQDLIKQKTYFKKYDNEYNNFNAKLSFINMRTIQETVIFKLEKLTILKLLANKSDYLIDKKNINFNISELIQNSQSIDMQLIDLIVNNLDEINLYGTNGLKDRLKIMEFKYDVL